jgi:hypothetical protein
MRRPTVQDASRPTHNNKFGHHEAATHRFGRPAAADDRSRHSQIWGISPCTWSHVLSWCLSGRSSVECRFSGCRILGNVS